MENASSYWNEFPSKLFNCCGDSRAEIEPEGEKVKETDFAVDSRKQIQSEFKVGLL